jgi:hypothetical protein
MASALLAQRLCRTVVHWWSGSAEAKDVLPKERCRSLSALLRSTVNKERVRYPFVCSGDVFDDHFPDAMAMAVQHGGRLGKLFSDRFWHICFLQDVAS